jgi:hypothetical protein
MMYLIIDLALNGLGVDLAVFPHSSLAEMRWSEESGNAKLP